MNNLKTLSSIHLIYQFSNVLIKMENTHNPKYHFIRFQILKSMAQVPHYDVKLCILKILSGFRNSKNQICPGTFKIAIFL